MKKIILISCLLLCIFFFSGCKQESTNEDNLECRSHLDCICNSSCGCVGEDMKDTKCEFLAIKKNCSNKKCICLNNKCVVQNNSEITTITGEYRGTKGGGSVDGVYVSYSELESDYYGKTIELKGYLSDYPCSPNSQCFSGPMMTNIQSVRIINK